MTIGPYELNDIYCGDSAVMLATLPDACIDLTVTSPPYDDMDMDFNPIPSRGLREYNGYTWNFKKLARQLYRVTKSGGVVVWVVGDVTIKGSESLASSLQKIYFRKVGFNLLDTMIYEQAGTGAKGSNYAYWQTWEYMFVFTKGTPTACNRIADKKNAQAGNISGQSVLYKSRGTRAERGRREIPEYSVRSNIWRYQVGNNGDETGGTDHPAIFPEALARDHIISWSNPGNIILDPFSGSGTTAKMAKMLQRQFIGFDISQEYVDLAKRRIAAAPVPLPFVMDEPAVKVEQVKLFCD